MYIKIRDIYNKEWSPEGFHIQVMSDNDDIFRFKTFKVEQK